MDDQEHDPEIPYSVEDLYAKFLVIPGFARLAVCCGCPVSDDGKLVPAVLFDWITHHYQELRAAAGLPALEETNSEDPMEVARFKVKNTLLTVADYAGSRTSRQEMQEAWRDLRETLCKR